MNNVSLIGRLTRDIEIKQAGQSTMCKFSIAVDGGKDKTDFVNCQAWTKTADFMAKFFSKGQRVGLTGRISTNNWTDKEGKKHFDQYVTVERAFFADGKREGNQTHSEPSSQEFPTADDWSKVKDENSEPIPF